MPSKHGKHTLTLKVVSQNSLMGPYDVPRGQESAPSMESKTNSAPFVQSQETILGGTRGHA